MSASTGLKSSEMKLSAVVGGGAAVPLILDFLNKGGDGMSETMKMVLIGAATLIVISFNISRGMAKTEVRNGPIPPSKP